MCNVILGFTYLTADRLCNMQFQGSRVCRGRTGCLERCFGLAVLCHFSPSLWVRDSGVFFQQLLPSLRIPQHDVQGQERTPRQFTSVEVIQRAIMWTVSKQALGLPNVDILLSSPAAPQRFQSEADRLVGESPKKKVHLSRVIDHQEDTEVPTLSRSQVDIYFQNQVHTAGAELLQEAAPSPEQIAAVEEQSVKVTRNHTQTSLFSLFFGRRMQLLMKLGNSILKPDGIFKVFGVPGPPDFDAWFACAKVYRATLSKHQVHSEGRSQWSLLPHWTHTWKHSECTLESLPFSLHRRRPNRRRSFTA